MNRVKRFFIWITDWDTKDYLTSLVIIIILLTAGWFYWYQYRPSQIYSACNETAKEKSRTGYKTRAELDPYDYDLQKAAEKGFYLPEDYEGYYKECLRERGLNK